MKKDVTIRCLISNDGLLTFRMKDLARIGYVFEDIDKFSLKSTGKTTTVYCDHRTLMQILYKISCKFNIEIIRS